MFGKSPVTDIRRAALAHEQAASNAAGAILDVKESVERVELVVFFVAAFFVALTVADRVWPRG